MKFTPILSFSLAAIASASLIERDAQPYKDVIESINTAVDNLDSAVKSYSGGDKKPVIDASDSLIKALDDGKKKVGGFGQLDPADALPLSGDLMSLQTKSQTLTDDLKSKRGDVEKAGQCDAVRGALNDISTSSQGLVDAAVSKLPKSLQSLAQPFVEQFVKGFNDTKDYFSTSNCKDGGGGGGSTTATSMGSQSTSTSSSTNSDSSTATKSGGSSASASPSDKGKSAASMLAPAWTLGTALGLFALFY